MEGLKYIAIALTTLGMGLTATGLGATFSSLFSSMLEILKQKKKSVNMLSLAQLSLNQWVFSH